MSDFGFDPADLFRRRPPGRPRPRVVRSGPIFPRGRRIAVAVVAVFLVLVIVAYSIMGLRVQLLFLDNLGHSNVFWTPLVAKLLLFLVGFAITAGLVALNLFGWVRIAGNLDRRGPRVTFWLGLALAAFAGIIGGAYLAGQWQDMLLWLHVHPFGQVDPVFNQDYSFFLFKLPAYDHLQGLAWGGVVVGLLGTLGLGALCLAVEFSPEDVPMPLEPPLGKSAKDGLRIVAFQAGIILVAIFILASLGSHFGVYHLATTQHDNFVGLDATQRDVLKPVLGFLQYLALALAVATAVVVWRRRASEPIATGIVLGSMLGGWLVVAGLLQGVPAAIYSGTRVSPNASTLQIPPIADYLTTTRYAWGLEPSTDVDVRLFGTPPGSRPVVPTVQDLVADPGTLRNIRIQDYRLLPETFAQIDRSRSYQTYPTVTVDRYRAPDGTETQVMLAPREIAEKDIPAQGFVNRAFQFTHGYGITVASVNRVASEGKPDLLAGNQPLRLIAPDAPPDLNVKDPRIYCGLATTQPVVVNTSQQEFDYLSGTQTGEVTNRYGDLPGGLPVPGGFDRLALSLNAFGGFDLFLTGSLQPDSKVFLHREIRDRIQQVAPFLRIDGDPYLVADPKSGHLVWIADAYVTSDRFPGSYRLDDGTSYMRNTVKAVVDARTCETTLYAVDLNEPITAAYNEIFPGLFTPLDTIPDTLRAHLRYPEDLFQAQARVYTAAHIDPSKAIDLFNKGDLYRIAQEVISGRTQDTQSYYVELTLPGETSPRFVLLQTFSPATSKGGGAASNVMTALLVARTDYTPENHNHPQLIAIPLSSGDNVLGPLQFDNNLNTDKDISSEITLLSQSGSSVVLGNVIVLPFNNHSFLYVRPMYVQASNGSFPQLREVLVGTQDRVAKGTSLAEALQNLFGQPVPGVPTAPGGPTPTPSPGGGTPTPTPTPGANIPLSPQVVNLLQDLLRHEAAAQAALQKGDYVTYGQEEAAVQRDLNQLKTLLGPDVNLISPTPSPKASPTP
jgi:uncharacterized membrane protein (UPF0182 family)